MTPDGTQLANEPVDEQENSSATGIPKTPVPRVTPGARKVVLISPYELGRQPFGLAQPAAWLKDAGFEVACLDLSQQMLEPDVLAGADVVALHLAMHTATRIAVEALPRIRLLAPDARLCVYGLYAPVNQAYFESLGVHDVIGGEFEPALLALATQVRDGTNDPIQSTHLGKIAFTAPARENLPELGQYARLIVPHPDSPNDKDEPDERVVGFVEASRGCKHLCRHCPIVPVYNGKFRIVPADIVLDDIDDQVRQGATHISFGDPDFLNGPTHAVRILKEFNARHPSVTFDATVKIEHLLKHQSLIPELANAGCLFLTSAVESVDDTVLEKLAKNHTAADFEAAVKLLRDAGIDMAPTFVAFNPWTSLENYAALLRRIAELDLVDSVPSVQLMIRLLIPAGSRLLELPGFSDTLLPFDQTMFGYPWEHADPRVDALQIAVRDIVEAGEQQEQSRHEIFRATWDATHQAMNIAAPPLPAFNTRPIPHHSEPWYCCAEPTEQQLASF